MKHLKGFDSTNGQEIKLSMPEVDKLVKQAGHVSRVSTDALVKDKGGRITHELYDYNNYIRWVEEHPAESAN